MSVFLLFHDHVLVNETDGPAGPLLQDAQEVNAEVKESTCVPLSAWRIATADGAEVWAWRTCREYDFGLAVRVELVQ
jgi:hypothetical protein